MQLPIARIMVPIDGSKNSIVALQAAVALASDYSAELIIVHVLTAHTIGVSLSSVSNTPPLAVVSEEEERSAKKIVDESVTFAKRHKVNARGQVLHGQTSIVESIVLEAEEEKVDLIVIGTRGLGGFKRLLIGSVSTGVVTHAHCPVFVVRSEKSRNS